MTLEEKLEHLQALSIEEARAEGNAIIDNYRKALEKVLEDHKAEALKQSEIRVKTESVNAKQQVNQAMAKAQLDLKRKQSRIQQELKEKIFDEVENMVKEFMKTDEYEDYLIKCIRKDVKFAGDDNIVIYINPSDENRRSDLQDATRALLRISNEDFIGGVRAIIKSRNILIDNSFKTLLANEFNKFMFLGGDGIA